MRRFILSLALVGVLGPCSSLAQQNDDLLVSTARDWGGDGGVFTCDQWRAYMTRLYRLADPKKRGYIDEKSFAVIPRTSSVFASATFDYFDQAGKGRVTKEEFLDFQSPFFARFDRKHNCHVTYEDIRAVNAAAAASNAPMKHRGGGGGRNGGGEGLGGGFGWRDNPQQ
jgi:hypothetical protein